MIAQYRILGSGEETALSFPGVLSPTEAQEPLGARFPVPFGIQTYDSFNLVSGALRVANQATDKRIALEAKQLLLAFLEVIQSLEVEVSNLPPLHAFKVDDSSLLIEWIFPDFRLGFSIEAEPQNSGWYLVATGNLGNIEASGAIIVQDRKKLLTWLVRFVVENS